MILGRWCLGSKTTCSQTTLVEDLHEVALAFLCRPQQRHVPPELVVDFDLFLNQDGSVARAPQLTASSQSAASSDSFTKAAADAAQRAIYECAPYKLPSDRYSQWREINPFHFDPRQMMGQ